MWKPLKKGEKLKFGISNGSTVENAIIGLTLSHNPYGGTIAVSVNGNRVKFDGNETISLSEPHQSILANHFSEPVELKKGNNEVILEATDADEGRKIGIDFVWLKEP